MLIECRVFWAQDLMNVLNVNLLAFSGSETINARKARAYLVRPWVYGVRVCCMNFVWSIYISGILTYVFGFLNFLAWII